MAMRRSGPIGRLVALSVLLAPVAASGESPGGSLAEFVSGAQIERVGRPAFARRNDIWAARPDGTLVGGYLTQDQRARGITLEDRGTVRGRWWVREPDVLCVEGEGLERDGPICMRITNRDERYTLFYFGTDLETGYRWILTIRPDPTSRRD